MKISEEIIKQYFESYGDVELLYIFGSRSQNRVTEDSDLDLAILSSKPLTVDELVDRKLKLSTLVKCEVDLVDLAQSHGAILDEIMCKGKLLICRNPKALENLIKRMWYEKEDDQRFSEITIKERLKQWKK